MNARLWILMLCCLAPLVQAQSLDKQALLEQIRETRSAEQAAMREREQTFLRERNQQQARLSQARAELASAQARADELDARFKAQSEQLAQLRQELTERSGNLGELFGVVRQGAGDTLSQWQDSLLNARYPERQGELEALAQSSRIPSVEVLEQFWYRLQQDMNASGEVARFSAPLIDRQGSQQAQGCCSRALCCGCRRCVSALSDRQPGVAGGCTPARGRGLAGRLSCATRGGGGDRHRPGARPGNRATAAHSGPADASVPGRHRGTSLSPWARWVLCWRWRGWLGCNWYSAGLIDKLRTWTNWLTAIRWAAC
ncbi:hypothetical protein ULG90_19900 [Halopseudomonas pachastrellae]|nr:hypothetical protein ULG90_19900 [Halopseudomonas pachastrellae]